MDPEEQLENIPNPDAVGLIPYFQTPAEKPKSPFVLDSATLGVLDRPSRLLGDPHG